MPLLRNGQWVENNPWTRLEDTDELPGHTSAQPADDTTALAQSEQKEKGHQPYPGSTALLCSLDRFLATDASERYQVSGIWLTPDDDVRRLRGHLDQVQIIAVDFPVYTDGRGYSQARQLRAQLDFSGEVRAFGDVRPDQILFMARAGIDTFDFAEHPDTELVESILSRYTVNYQPSYALPIAG